MLFISILTQAVATVLLLAAIGVIILMAVDFFWIPDWKKDHPLD